MAGQRLVWFQVGVLSQVLVEGLDSGAATTRYPYGLRIVER